MTAASDSASRGQCEPKYWRNETGGVLRPAVEVYLSGATMSLEQIAAMRAYLRQWVMAPVWDDNPYAGTRARVWLSRLRHRIIGLTSREAIDKWLADAVSLGIDPL